MTGARRGFTLLEAAVAIVLLSGVIVASLLLRAQAIERSARVEAALDDHRVCAQVLDFAATGLLEETVDDLRRIGETGFAGSHLGRPFRITVEPVEADVELGPAGDDAAPDPAAGSRVSVAVSRFVAVVGSIELDRLVIGETP